MAALCVLQKAQKSYTICDGCCVCRHACLYVCVIALACTHIAHELSSEIYCACILSNNETMLCCFIIYLFKVLQSAKTQQTQIESA